MSHYQRVGRIFKQFYEVEPTLITGHEYDDNRTLNSNPTMQSPPMEGLPIFRGEFAANFAAQSTADCKCGNDFPTLEIESRKSGFYMALCNCISFS